jgi:hypothetical protein
MTVRALLALCLSLLLASLPAGSISAGQPEIEVWKAPNCNCCEDWVAHLEENGFTVKANGASQSMLDKIKRQAGITDKLASCHTGKIDGYVIEGHVPAADIKRLIAERPEAAGLTVPGMPIGSPGMEVGDQKEPYDVLLLKKDGTTDVFAKH